MKTRRINLNLDGLAIVADMHNEEKYNFPIEDVPKNFFTLLLETCSVNNYGLVLNGDTSNKRTLSAGLSNFLAKTFSNFSSRGIPIFINPGNHEIMNVAGDTFLTQYKHLKIKNVFVSERPTRTILPNAALYFVPYMPLRFLRDALIGLNGSDKDVNLLFGHFPIKGAKYVSAVAMDGITIEELQRIGKKFDHIFVGHFHKRQKITKNCNYTGIPWQVSFEDENMPTGFDTYNFKTKRAEYVRTFTPKFRTVYISSKEDLKEELYQCKDDIAKIMIRGDRKFINGLNLDKIKKKFLDSEPRFLLMPTPTIVSDKRLEFNMSKTMTGEEVISKYIKRTSPDHLPIETTRQIFLQLYERAKSME